VIRMNYGLILPQMQAYNEFQRYPPADLWLLRPAGQLCGLVSVRRAVPARARDGSCTIRGSMANISSTTWRISMSVSRSRWRVSADRCLRAETNPSTEGSRRFVMEAGRTFALSMSDFSRSPRGRSAMSRSTVITSGFTMRPVKPCCRQRWRPCRCSRQVWALPSQNIDRRAG
jgi:hypothetical protein